MKRQSRVASLSQIATITIICFGQRLNSEDYKDDEKVISILTSIDKYRGFYYNSQGFRYKYCKPFNPSEYINVAEDLKEYEK